MIMIIIRIIHYIEQLFYKKIQKNKQGTVLGNLREGASGALGGGAIGFKRREGGIEDIN